jgi:hypothetical protein
MFLVDDQAFYPKMISPPFDGLKRTHLSIVLHKANIYFLLFNVTGSLFNIAI